MKVCILYPLQLSGVLVWILLNLSLAALCRPIHADLGLAMTSATGFCLAIPPTHL